uniref:helix-turn-helix domain-containing protein n=1 Tax=Rhizomonospora bruguierae TaxID=1581705 RepID=UPI001BD07271
MDIDPGWWDTASFEGRPVAASLEDRDVSAVLRFLRSRGFSRARLAALTGLSETRVRQIAQGRQRVTSYEVLERFATGLRIPRWYLGIGSRQDAERPTGGAGSTDRGLHPDALVQDSWDDLLGVLANRIDTCGRAGLRRPVEGQLRLISTARRSTAGDHRRRLLVTEARWTEFLSWVAANGRTPARAHPLLTRAHKLAVEAEAQPLAAYMLMRQSQQALDDGDATRAVGLARQARQLCPLPSRTLALCLVREAEGHALADEADACRDSIG